MQITQIATEGLLRAEQRLEQAAAKVARSTELRETNSGDTLDLSPAARELIESRNGYKANARLFNQASQCKVINILA
ncbi:MAG: hypothetical protein FJW40_01470 [Acidobacteria bacterium]|nr:hypothetical protein [Acidobacteriota bacterium]